MKCTEDIRYILHQGSFFKLLFIKRCGKIMLYAERQSGYNSDLLPADNAYYMDIKLVWNKDSSPSRFSSARKEKEFCYVLLKDSKGNGLLKELVENETILSGFLYKDCIHITKTITRNTKRTEDDVVLSFCNIEKKQFSQYSIVEGEIFAPYNYSSIELYFDGVILDNEIVVEYDGCTIDLKKYVLFTEVEEGEILYNKDDDSYLLHLDGFGSAYVRLYSGDEDEYDDNIVKSVERNRHIFVFNIKKKELVWKVLRDDYYETNWGDYADIAYEGYSRLELGLDD